MVAGKDGGGAASLRAEEAGGRDKVGSKMSVGDIDRVGGRSRGGTVALGLSGLPKNRVTVTRGRGDWKATPWLYLFC